MPDAIIRKAQLDAMRKDELRAEVERLDQELATRLLPMSFHVAGAPHRGTEVRVIRCAPSGEDADRWMVVYGGEMLMRSGQRLPVQAWHQQKPQIQRETGMTWDEAIKLARKIPISISAR